MNSEKKNEKNNNIEILERYLGFLGVILALVMTIAWDFINSSKYETGSEGLRFTALLYYIICLLLLGLICVFFILRYEGKEKEAQFLGRSLLVFFLAALFLGLVPLSPFISFDIFYLVLFVFGVILSYPTWILLRLQIKPLIKRILSKFKD